MAPEPETKAVVHSIQRQKTNKTYLYIIWAKDDDRAEHKVKRNQVQV